MTRRAMKDQGPRTKDKGQGTKDFSRGPGVSPGCGRGSLVPRPSSFARRGFTLVELLVAAGITAMIAGIVAVAVRNVSTSWKRAGNRLGTDAQARLVLDQLQLDLQGAMFRDDGNAWFAVEVLNGATGNAGTPWQVAQRNAKPTGGVSLDMAATRAELTAAERGKLEQARFGTAGVWLRFFTQNRPVTSTAGAITRPSAPVAVSYQIVRRFIASNTQNTNTAYLLHRVEARPALANNRIGVLEAGFDLTSGNYTTSTSSTNNGSQFDDPRAIRVVATSPRGGLESVIADNVIDFGVRCYVRDTNVPGGLRLIFPANGSGGLSNSTGATTALVSRLPSDTPTTIANYNHRQLFPDVVDVMVRILTDEGAQLIANIERNQNPPLTVPVKYNSNAAQWWWGVATENSRVYTRRIVVNAKSS